MIVIHVFSKHGKQRCIDSTYFRKLTAHMIIASPSLTVADRVLDVTASQYGGSYSEIQWY